MMSLKAYTLKYSSLASDYFGIITFTQCLAILLFFVLFCFWGGFCLFSFGTVLLTQYYTLCLIKATVILYVLKSAHRQYDP